LSLALTIAHGEVEYSKHHTRSLHPLASTASGGNGLTAHERAARQALKTASVNIEKFEMLKQYGEQWLSDFAQGKNYTFTPGSVIKADAYGSLVMSGTGMAVQILSLSPCICHPNTLSPECV
jgi:hypothetical protein